MTDPKKIITRDQFMDGDYDDYPEDLIEDEDPELFD